MVRTGRLAAILALHRSGLALKNRSVYVCDVTFRESHVPIIGIGGALMGCLSYVFLALALPRIIWHYSKSRTRSRPAAA